MYVTEVYNKDGMPAEKLKKKRKTDHYEQEKQSDKGTGKANPKGWNLRYEHCKADPDVTIWFDGKYRVIQ